MGAWKFDVLRGCRNKGSVDDAEKERISKPSESKRREIAPLHPEPPPCLSAADFSPYATLPRVWAASLIGAASSYELTAGYVTGVALWTSLRKQCSVTHDLVGVKVVKQIRFSIFYNFLQSGFCLLYVLERRNPLLPVTFLHIFSRMSSEITGSNCSILDTNENHVISQEV